MDLKVFYDTLRPTLNLTRQNVLGTDKILAYGQARGTETNDLAYILATAWWESGQTMHPVVEAFWMSEDWRRRNLRYHPWHGRGLVQTTWRENYVKIGNLLGVDFTKQPSKLLQWEYALPALFVGMERGIYTGKKLSDYIDEIDEADKEDLREYANARRIVNGTDRQVDIGKIALTFEKALRRSGYVPGGRTEIPVPSTPPDAEVPPPVPLPPESKPEPPKKRGQWLYWAVPIAVVGVALYSFFS